MTGVTDTNVNRGKSHLKLNIFSLNGNWEETRKTERGRGKITTQLESRRGRRGINKSLENKAA